MPPIDPPIVCITDPCEPAAQPARRRSTRTPGSTACPRPRSSTGSPASGAACRISTTGETLRAQGPRELRRPVHRYDPGPVRQRANQDSVGLTFNVVIQGEVRVSGIVRTERADQALPGHARRRRTRPRHRRGRDLRPGRPERCRQDDDAADPRDAPQADRRRGRGRRHLRPPEPRRSRVASSASCPTPSVSTTTCGSGSTWTSSPAATASRPPGGAR